MNNAKGMRFLIEQQKVALIMEQEGKWGYTRIPKELTNLDYDVYLDDNKTYEKFNHELWLYADCGKYGSVPITISETPCVKYINRNNMCSLSQIYDFIIYNKDLIEKYANEKIESLVLWEVLENLKKSDILLEERDYTKQSILKPKQTGLPMDIWVDEDKTYKHHSPRIKFKASKENKSSREFPSISLIKPYNIYNLPKNHDLSKRDLDKLREFVSLYGQDLIKLADKEINLKDFLYILQNTNDDTDYAILTQFICGFAICVDKRTKKYNYINTDKQLLLPQFVDEVGEFRPINSNESIATIVQNGKKKIINNFGKIIS